MTTHARYFGSIDLERPTAGSPLASMESWQLRQCNLDVRGTAALVARGAVLGCERERALKSRRFTWDGLGGCFCSWTLNANAGR